MAGIARLISHNRKDTAKITGTGSAMSPNANRAADSRTINFPKITPGITVVTRNVVAVKAIKSIGSTSIPKALNKQ